MRHTDRCFYGKMLPVATIAPSKKADLGISQIRSATTQAWQDASSDQSHVEAHNEMIADLLKDGDEGSDDARLQARRHRRRVVLATHGPIAHMLGGPCIHIFPKPEWHRYPLVHSRNIFSVLNHESVHCAIQRIFGFDESDKVNSALDHIIGMINQSKILAGVT